MISVEEALQRLFALVGTLDAEPVPIREAAGRVLASPLVSCRTQPPFDASAMDGYAVAGAVPPGTVLTVMGVSRAGERFDGTVSAGEAARIFTGAPVPRGADRIVVQENVVADDTAIRISEEADEGQHIRKAGQDFAAGDAFSPLRRLRPTDIALIAAMGHETVLATRRPVVAIIATGDELAMPGEALGPDDIVASNGLGLAAMIEAAGGEARLLPIARDTGASLNAAFELARGADLIVTIGGASVGDHDLVRAVAGSRGMEPAFYKIAMRPGKPLMAGRLDQTPVIGLPGNPVSSMVCGRVFILPAIDAMLGLGAEAAPRSRAPLARPVAGNGEREHYMRARLSTEGLVVFDRQDSALLGVLSQADALVVRPPHDPAREAGSVVEYLPL